MMTIKEKIEAANREYAAHKKESAHPDKKFAILTCMDARMDPVLFAGLSDDAYVVRNAGGRATEDAVRSLVISAKLLGTSEWYVIHHTDCGMAGFTNDTMRRLLGESLGRAVFENGQWNNVTDEPGADPGTMDFLPFEDAAASVIEDVRILRHHPLVSRSIPIYGYLYDIHTGKLTEIEEASREGRPREE